MKTPKFIDLAFPILEVASDGGIHSIRSGMDDVAGKLGLTDAQQNDLLPSGTQTRYYNRFCWSVTYLRKAGLLSSPKRGHFQITNRGLEVVASAPGKIELDDLKRFPEFIEFRQQGASRNNQEPIDGQEDDGSIGDSTPEEMIETGYKELRQRLAADILERISSCPPEFFERLVVELLVRMGYGGTRADAGRAVGRSGDGGIDGIINEDKLGLDSVYIQAKRWDSSVGRPTVQAFAGSLEGYRAHKGVLITTSSFTSDALEYVKHIQKRIVLIDGPRLASLMIDHELGVSTVATYPVCRVDNDFFEPEE